MGRDWPNHKYGMREALVRRRMKYGDMDEFAQFLYPGAFMGGVDFQACFCVGSCFLSVGVFRVFDVQFRGDSVYLHAFRLGRAVSGSE